MLCDEYVRFQYLRIYQSRETLITRFWHTSYTISERLHGVSEKFPNSISVINLNNAIARKTKDSWSTKSDEYVYTMLGLLGSRVISGCVRRVRFTLYELATRNKEAQTMLCSTWNVYRRNVSENDEAASLVLTTYAWRTRFKDGRQSLDDDEPSGRSAIDCCSRRKCHVRWGIVTREESPTALIAIRKTTA